MSLYVNLIFLEYSLLISIMYMYMYIYIKCINIHIFIYSDWTIIMSVIKFLTEMLLQEKLPMKLAKYYTKKGRENAEDLPPELEAAYNKMFGTDNRKKIGEVAVEVTITDKKSEYEPWLKEIWGYATDNPKEGVSPNILDSITVKYNEEDPKLVQLQFNGNNADLARKEMSQAKSNEGSNLYLLKTVIKRLKKYVEKSAFQKAQFRTGQYLTKIGFEQLEEVNAPVVLSRHPYDVGGMSLGTRWESCKNAIDGCNRKYLENEVGMLLIAYVVNPDAKGKDLLADPYSRLLVIPVTNKDTGELGMYVSTDIYGKDIPGFGDVVANFIDHYIPVFGDNDELLMVGDFYKDTNFPGVMATEEEYTDIIDEIISDIKIPTSVKDTIYDTLWELWDANDRDARTKAVTTVNKFRNTNIKRDIESIFDISSDIGLDFPAVMKSYEMDILELLKLVDSDESVISILTDIIYEDDNLYDINQLLDAGILHDMYIGEYINTKAQSFGPEVFYADKGLPSLVSAVNRVTSEHDDDERFTEQYDGFTDSIDVTDMTDIVSQYSEDELPRDSKLTKFLKTVGYAQDEIYDIMEA